MKLERAKVRDAAAIAALRTAANQHLTARYGTGHWSGCVTERWVRFRMRNEHVYVMRHRGVIVATFILATKKPWSIDRSYFSPVKRPLYMIEVAVTPAMQRKGIGTKCVAAATVLCKAWPADALMLDAHDAAAGAGGFYRRCGFREVGRASYRKVPLVYFEKVIAPAEAPSKR